MITRIECDVLCIGAGGAGLVAAVTAAEAGADVVAVSKGLYGCGNTRIAGGLVLYPNISPKDSTDSLMRDMIAGGEFLNDQSLVEKFCQRAHLGCELMEKFGVLFSRRRSGELAPIPVPLGGHSLPRTLSGLSEGIPIGTALRAAAARTGVKVLDETHVLKLLQDGKAITGAVCLRWLTGEMTAITAKQTILATGGLGWLFYPHTSNSRSLTGDGYALALEAGAELIDMEQQQFLPFALTHPDSMVGLICGEPASAGPYGRLVDANDREVISNVRTKTRAQVSAAIAAAKERGDATEHGGVLLDLSPNFRSALGEKMFEFLKRTFPAMLGNVRTAYGREAAQGRVPWDVYPTGHYQMGGVRVDPECRVKGVDNLFAVGEVLGGLHGANRIGSTSLAELFIFGSLAGKLAAETAKITEPSAPDDSRAEEACTNAEALLGKAGEQKPIELIRKLQRTMWENAGPIRDRARLASALENISELAGQHNDIGVSNRRDCNPEWADALEFKKMLLVAEAVIRSAIAREESRGGHVRLDFPRRNDANWLKNVVVEMKNRSLSTRTEPVELSRFGLDAKGGPNPVRDRIQFLILNLLPRKTQEKILNARLNLGDDV